MHDDRSYTAALLGWALAEERRKDMLKKPRSSGAELSSLFYVRKPTSSTIYNN